MKLSTKAAVVSGARKVAAILFSALCSAQLVDDWYDWFWIVFFVLAQWAIHFEAERLLLRKRLKALKKQPINQSINVSVPESNPTIRVVAPPWGRRTRQRSANSTYTVATKVADPAPAPAPAPVPSTSNNVEDFDEPPAIGVLQRLSQIDISKFGRIFKSSEPVIEEPAEEDEDETDTAESDLIADMRRDELISALRNLGYKNTAQSIADFVISENPDADLETLIRTALRLSRKK